MNVTAVATNVDEGNLWNFGLCINSEFNQYLDYYFELLKTKDLKNILILEDDPICQRMLEASVHQFDPNINCFYAQNELEVLNVLNVFSCELVLADYYLGGEKSGLEICQTICERHPNTRCIVVSSIGFHQYLEIAKTLPFPAPEFLEKTAASTQMKQLLTTFLKGPDYERRDDNHTEQ